MAVEDPSAPQKKRYGHFGKRHKAYTEEMFRCQFTDMISRTPLVCGHLLWKKRLAELREHLLEHLPSNTVIGMTDEQVQASYQNASRIRIPGIPDEIPDDDECADSGAQGE